MGEIEVIHQKELPHVKDSKILKNEIGIGWEGRELHGNTFTNESTVRSARPKGVCFLALMISHLSG